MSNVGPVLAPDLSSQRAQTFGWPGDRGHRVVTRDASCYPSVTSAAVQSGGSRMVSVANQTPLPALMDEALFATAISGPDRGRIIPVEMFVPTVNGVPDTVNTQYFNLLDTPPSDVTALVNTPDYLTLQRPAPFQLGSAQITVTGGTPVGLGVFSNWVNYAEVYINYDVNAPAGIRWTKDGQTPTATLGEQEAPGSTIRLYDRSELFGFRALVTDADGVLTPALTTHLTVTFSNVNPEN